MAANGIEQFIAYNLALDAAEAAHKCNFLHRHLNHNPKMVPVLRDDEHFRYLDVFSGFVEQINPEIRINVSSEMLDNLTLGKPFTEETIDALKEEGLSYSPEAYRGFLNLFITLRRDGLLHEDFSSDAFLDFFLRSYVYCTLISDREMEHLPKTNFALLSNLASDFTDANAVFMPNRKMVTDACEVQELPHAQTGRPIVLLHGRFNGPFAINYLEAIMSIATAFEEMPCLIIGIDDDISSMVLKNQVPFMNQIFRAGFYTLSPLVSGVFLTDRNAYKDFDQYWGRVYDDMCIDYLVLEETDPLLDIKTKRLHVATSGRARVMTRKSEFLGVPRLSGSEIKRGDARVVEALSAQWTGLAMDLTKKYFSDDSGRGIAVLDKGNRQQPLQLPLQLI